MQDITGFTGTGITGFNVNIENLSHHIDQSRIIIFDVVF